MLASLSFAVPENWITFHSLDSLWISRMLYGIYPQLYSLTALECQLSNFGALACAFMWRKMGEKWILVRWVGLEKSCVG